MASQQAETAGHKGMTAAGMFWYIVGCISFGAAYFAKVPVKKAMADFGLVHLTGAETFWYYLGCVFFRRQLLRQAARRQGAVRAGAVPFRTGQAA